MNVVNIVLQVHQKYAFLNVTSYEFQNLWHLGKAVPISFCPSLTNIFTDEQNEIITRKIQISNLKNLFCRGKRRSNEKFIEAVAVEVGGCERSAEVLADTSLGAPGKRFLEGKY